VETPRPLDIIRNLSSVLIIRLNDIGEVVMTLPSVDAVRRALPAARIGVLVSPPCHELFLHDERVNQVFVFEKKLWRERPTARGIKQLITLLRDLRRNRFDVAIDLHNNPSTHWLALASGARFRVSLDSNYWSRRLLSRRIPVEPSAEGMHNVERHFHVLSSVGIATRGAEYSFALDVEAKARVEASLKQETQPGRPRILLQPGAGLPERCWPVQRFAELAERLMREIGAQVVVHCGPNEDHLGQRIHQEVRQPVILARRLSLQELAGLLTECDLLVTNDSGPMHLAAAVGTPIVAIFGPTDPRWCGPFGARAEIVTRNLDCSPCGVEKFACVRRDCLTQIPVDEVHQAVLRLLRTQRNQTDQESPEIASAGAS
jgi:lipopolysaccharide heptosyltransferase II